MCTFPDEMVRMNSSLRRFPKMYQSAVLSWMLALFLVSTALAEKNAKLAAKIAPLDSPAMLMAFDKPNGVLPKSSDGVWLPVKGKWAIIDGTLVGQELAADKDAAVLNYQKPNRNSAVRFRLRWRARPRDSALV